MDLPHAQVGVLEMQLLRAPAMSESLGDQLLDLHARPGDDGYRILQDDVLVAGLGARHCVLLLASLPGLVRIVTPRWDAQSTCFTRSAAALPPLSIRPMRRLRKRGSARNARSAAKAAAPAGSTITLRLRIRWPMASRIVSSA